MSVMLRVGVVGLGVGVGHIESYRELGARFSVEAICESAGVGRATFFRHFETKSLLLREYNRRTAEILTRRLAALPASTNAIDRLRVLADTIHDRWVDAGPGLRDLNRDAVSMGDTSGARLYPELQDAVREVVSDGRSSNLARFRHAPPPMAMMA